MDGVCRWDGLHSFCTFVGAQQLTRNNNPAGAGFYSIPDRRYSDPTLVACAVAAPPVGT
jgi:hypothetical protein